MSKVVILLSTYNGISYLRDQIDSILNQKDVDIHLVIRDDGSSDDTCEILKMYASKYSNISLLIENNVGCEKSFESLYKYVHKNCQADYYAFADQDDVWFPEKLSRSIAVLEKESKPALFCCNQIITDESLTPLHIMIQERDFKHMEEVLSINYLKNRHGCTMVWNHALMEVLGESTHQPCYTPGHDKWLMLLARCAGRVIVSSEALQYYRVHSSNTSGYATGILNKLKKGIKYYWLKDQYNPLYVQDCFSSIAKLEGDRYGISYLMDVEKYKKNIFKRFKVAFSPQIWSESVNEGIIHSIAVLIGKY